MTDFSNWGGAGLGTLALISAWCHGPASPVLPAAFEPVLLAYGRMYPPLVVALVATLASIPAEALNYAGYGWLVHARRFGRMRQASARVTRLFERRPFVATVIIAVTPIPDWSARILGALARYSSARYLAAFAIGRLPLFWLLAATGQVIRVPRGAVLALMLVSIVATYGALALRRWRRPRPGEPELARNC